MTPNEILNVAITKYRSCNGSESDLENASWELEQIGTLSWEVLTSTVLLPECEYFLGAIVRLEGVSSSKRCKVLEQAIKHSDPNVISRLYELASESLLVKEILEQHKI